MHGRGSKAPEWVRIICQEVRSAQGIFPGPNGFTAQGTVSPPSFDLFHGCKVGRTLAAAYRTAHQLRRLARLQTI